MEAQNQIKYFKQLTEVLIPGLFNFALSKHYEILLFKLYQKFLRKESENS